MRTGFTLKSFAVAMALLCTATGGAGLTLGRAQGLALVGQPLDLRIQVQFDSNEDAQGACLNAEVFYGDAQVDPSRVSIVVDAAADAAARPAAVRVSATVPVNEPVVTVNLRSGCQMRSSKRYTLLADLQTQVVEPQVRAPSRVPAPPVDVPVVAAPLPAALVLAAVPKEPVAVTAPRPIAPRKPKAAPAAASALKSAVPPTVAPPVQAVVAPPLRASKPVRGSSRARLKLDPLDLLIERDPVLRASDELLSQPQEGGSQRAEAAALWRALNATPEQMLREEVQAQRAAENLKALYTVTNENQKGLIELAAKVERAESERYANGLVYTLMALCLLSLVALVWIWQRMRNAHASDWKHGLDAGDSLMAELVQANVTSRRDVPPEPQPAEPAKASPAAPRPAQPPHAVVVATPPPAALTEVDLDLDLIHPPGNEHLRTPPPATDPWAAPADSAPSAWRRLEVPQLPVAPREAPNGGIDFSVSMSPALRSIDTEELEDVRHQAEFFVSLGQQDKAIDILTARIAQCGESSPLVCLDLLKLYHAMGRESEYAFMRAEFQHWFTGQVPEFADFGYEGRPLDRYPQVMSRIVNLWPGPRVLEYIEDCLYHHAGAVDGQDFDLQAYRDLLLLHTVAKRIMRMADDQADADGHIPEVVRIPQVHRAGAHLRGARPRDAEQAPDPQADVDTRGAPLGPMKVPPPSVPPDDTASRPPGNAADDQLTDFNFLNLR